MVNVFKSNFIEQSNDFLRHLPDASFISIDEEMTGIMLPVADGKPAKPAKEDSPADRYPAFKQIPERYSIVQLGICLFTKPDASAAAAAAATATATAVDTAASPAVDSDADVPAVARPEPQPNDRMPSEVSESSSLGNVDDAANYDQARYHVRRFNFTLFPPTNNWITRDVTMNPSSIQFLQEHGLNLDEWVKKGIPFVTSDIAKNAVKEYFDKAMQSLDEHDGQTQSGGPASAHKQRRPVTLTTTEDKRFHARAMAGLREWIDAAIVPQDEDPEGASYLLPPCNSFLRRALYQTIEREYPSLVLETVAGQNQIRAWRLSEVEKKLRQERLRREEWEKLLCGTIGMWRIFKALSMACRGELNRPGVPSSSQARCAASSLEEHVAMSLNVTEALNYNESHSGGVDDALADALSSADASTGRKIPLVVHNGLQDLLFLMTHFQTRILPDTWAECKRLIHHCFPVIYDTKTMSIEHKVRQPNQQHPTYLSAVFEREITGQPQWQNAFVHRDSVMEALLARGTAEQRLALRQYQRQVSGAQEHEASYDAFMTGASFASLVETLQEQYNYPQMRPLSQPANHENEGGGGFAAAAIMAMGDGNGDSGAASAAVIPMDGENPVEVWKLSPEDDLAKRVYGRNRLYFHLSPFTIDLERDSDDDPLGRDMSTSAIFRVSDIDPSVSTRHIVAALSGLTDSHDDRINYEIVWVDDTTFLVAVTIPNCRDESRFRDQGRVLHSALVNRFSNAIVLPFIGFRDKLKGAREARRLDGIEQERLRHEQHLHDVSLNAGPSTAVSVGRPPSDAGGVVAAAGGLLSNLVGYLGGITSVTASFVSGNRGHVAEDADGLEARGSKRRRVT